MQQDVVLSPKQNGLRKSAKWAMSVLLLLVSFQSLAQESFITLMSSKGDTLFKTMGDPDSIIFNGEGLQYDFDMAILSKSVINVGQCSLPVPLMKNGNNTFVFCDSIHSNIPFYIPNLEGHKRVQFKGNNYLRSYQSFTDRLFKQFLFEQTGSALALAGMYDKALKLYKAYPSSQYASVSFVILNDAAKDPAFQSKKVRQYQRQVKKISCKSEGQYYAVICSNAPLHPIDKACIKVKADSLVYQSSVSILDENLYKNKINVVFFWATWCGPCKPILLELAELNKQIDQDQIFIEAVSIDSDPRGYFSFIDNHPEFEDIGHFIDDKKCMRDTYGVVSIPIMLVFDRNNKLISRDPTMEELKLILKQNTN